MKFHSRDTLYGMYLQGIRKGQKGLGLGEFYKYLIVESVARGLDKPLPSIDGTFLTEVPVEHQRQLGSFCSIPFEISMGEACWYLDCRPYYKVWPAICPALGRLKLDIPGERLALGDRSWGCCMRFCVGAEPSAGAGDKWKVRTILVNYCDTTDTVSVDARFNGDMLGSVIPVLLTDKTIEEELQRMRIEQWFVVQDQEHEDASIWCVRAALTVLLLRNDPDFVVPDVLAKDRHKYDATKDPKYIAKAKRRGIVGWRIGESYESCPHIRRPHFGLRWTGKGKAIPRIVPVKGSVVHRKKLTEVPTGYLTPDGIEVESSMRS